MGWALIHRTCVPVKGKCGHRYTQRDKNSFVEIRVVLPQAKKVLEAGERPAADPS